MDQVGQIWRGEVMDGLKCIQEDFESGTKFNWEPVKLL